VEAWFEHFVDNNHHVCFVSGREEIIIIIIIIIIINIRTKIPSYQLS
jgi:hypothetical protein